MPEQGMMMQAIQEPPKPDALFRATDAVGFTMPGLFNWLEAAADADIDALPFGLVAMAADGTVKLYSRMEAKMSGLAAARVVGRHFFTSVAPCTNNFMIAHRFEQEPALDTIFDYVFTFIMKPQKVRLRMLKQPGGRRMYLAVERRA